LQNDVGLEDKQRIIQEFVPGKQITLAHVIAKPISDIYSRLGLEHSGAIGIVTLTPGETSIIAADIATKAAEVYIGFLDRFTGALVIGGDVASVETALKEVNNVLNSMLGYTTCSITKT
jgi:ethanolamine utilization protein EutS